MTDDRQSARLRQQLLLLDEQVKALVQSEQQLFRYQKALDLQLHRQNAINHFALEAAAAFEPQQIVEIAMRSLGELFSLEQGLALISPVDEDRGALELAARYSRRGMAGRSDLLFDTEISGEHPHLCFAVESARVLSREPCVGPREAFAGHAAYRELVDLIDNMFGPPPAASPALSSEAPCYIVLPLLGQRLQQAIGIVVMRNPAPERRSFHDTLPGQGDLPFIQAFGSHVATTLDNALLHTRLTRLALSLERRVEERTVELSDLNTELESSIGELKSTQDQLLRAGKMAAIGTLVAGLSHELNTPLNVIIGYAASLLGDVEPNTESEAVDALQAIERQARRCSRLVASLLDYSRGDEQERVLVRPEEIIDRVHGLASSRARNEGIAFVIEVSEAALPPLEANTTELESALLNLVNNGFDALEGSGSLSLSVGARASDGTSGIEFRVIDDGPGIASGLLDRIFDPFFTTKPVGKGIGLGLALTQRIVEAHGGRISVESDAAVGTAVRVWLPASTVALTLP